MVEGGKACRKLVNPIVGECDKCKIPFCMTHRLYEDHQCRELPTTKMELYQANAEQLLKEQTQVVKI